MLLFKQGKMVSNHISKMIIQAFVSNTATYTYFFISGQNKVFPLMLSLYICTFLSLLSNEQYITFDKKDLILLVTNENKKKKINNEYNINIENYV